ncbi:MAG: CARDB domain-containing protein, partial [Betaproteobacteria bacterium]
IYFSPDPELIPSRAVFLASVEHANLAPLAAGASYTTSATVKLPPGTDGPYYIYVVTDAVRPGWEPPRPNPEREAREGWGDTNTSARDRLYAGSAFEGLRNDNNIGRGTLNVTYREPDLVVSAITVSDPNPGSGQTITATWTVTNQGTRATRVPAWFDGVYLSRDATLDAGDFPLVDRGQGLEQQLAARLTSIADAAGRPRFLQPGESYTNSATFKLPSSISGDFRLIVKTDTDVFNNSYGTPSTIREGLRTVSELWWMPDAVLEFRDEGNNVRDIALPVRLIGPPDLRVARIAAPERVVAGQSFQVNYEVRNFGGETPADQGRWYDMVYLSRDRFLDTSKDRYLGYVEHTGGLGMGESYEAALSFSAPRDLEGAYYVFVVTDPSRAGGAGEGGRVVEFGGEDNNDAAPLAPMLIETPPPADLVVQSVTVPSGARIGEEVEITFTIANTSASTAAIGRWTDALYLSADGTWGLDDVLLGRVERVGDVAANGSYSGTLRVKLPPLKQGAWRVLVRPDLFNEVFEGPVTYTQTGLNVAPGEANNRTASAATLNVQVPELVLGTTQAIELGTGAERLYRITVEADKTLRVALDASAAIGANELYIRYGDVPTGTSFDAAYSDPLAPDQELLVPSTQAGTYYVLVRARQATAGAPTAATLRADALSLSITRVTPDQGGTGDDDHRWVTVDIEGARFAAGALVKLSRPGEFEIEPARWQVLDATRIRAVFDLRHVPHGLYDLTVINPDGQRVTEPYRYLVERMIEPDVTIGIGGPRNIEPGDGAVYSVSLQSLTNVDTPYVRFDIGATEMGRSADVLQGLNLPYVVFGSNVGGRPPGAAQGSEGNTQGYGTTPTRPLRSDVPWASLDGTVNTEGWNLAPGYAFDLAGSGFAGFTFNVQTYPGLAEWKNYDFEGLRDKLYAARPDWKASGLLDGGVQDLDKIERGLAAKFLSRVPEIHLGPLEMAAMPFRFDTLGAATPLTREEFIADQREHAKRLRTAILADASAASTLTALAADEAQWVQGWLAALETAGLLRPADEAPAIRTDELVLSLNATLASGVLIGRAGQSYRTQADLLGFFAKVQQWYGDTARWAGD